MIPCVTEPENVNPRGFPIAMTGSPAFKLSELPNSATFVISFAATSTTAKSVQISAPISLALIFFHRIT